MFLFTMEIVTAALSHLAGAACWGQKQDSVSRPRKSSDHTRVGRGALEPEGPDGWE